MSSAFLTTVPTPEQAWKQRYGFPPESVPESWSSTLDLLAAHRSVRRYLPREVSDDVLRSLVLAAQSASTSSNLQVWSVVVVRDSERKARLAELCGNQRHVVEAPLFLVWLADYARHRQVAEDRNAPLDGQEYLEAAVMGCVDAALAAQNALVAAESLGLGGVYIGGIRNHPEAVAEVLGLPEGVFGVFGMCLGYPDPAEGAEVKPRLPQEAVLHFETYNLATQREQVDRYEQRIAEFYQGQNLSQSWVARVLKRLGGPEGLTGRHRLLEAWQKLGFKMR